MVQRVGHGSGLFRTLYSLPVAVSGAGAAMLFAALYDPSIGLLSHLFGKKILWLVDKRFALWAVAIVTVWQALGINFIFMLAGLQGIPEEQYESAALDGAGWWATTRYITLPGLMPTLFFLTVTGVIASLQAFGPINLLTLGGPEDSTMVLSYAIYREAFFNFRYDASSAMAMVFFVIMMGVTLVQFKLEGKGVHYGA
jgi:sn-glycerol 3-phosphate transport system permease protein